MNELLTFTLISIGCFLIYIIVNGGLSRLWHWFELDTRRKSKDETLADSQQQEDEYIIIHHPFTHRPRYRILREKQKHYYRIGDDGEIEYDDEQPRGRSYLP